jgi:hypothetical protein
MSDSTATTETTEPPVITYSHTSSPATADERTRTMTIRVYDWCPEHGAHLDPDLPQGYVENGI